MSHYRRAWCPGGTFFFTINAQERGGNDVFVRHIDKLRAAIAKTKQTRPFHIHAWVVLPDHMHCVIELPPADTDYSTRIRLMKNYFARSIPANEYRKASNIRRSERGVWQRRFWEHQIRDEEDYANHIDYVHFNPVIHGLVTEVREWKYSTFHRYQKYGILPANWSGGKAKGRRVD